MNRFTIVKLVLILLLAPTLQCREVYSQKNNIHTSEDLMIAFQELEDNILNESTGHEQAVQDFIIFLDEYKLTNSWNYFVIQNEDFSGTIEQIQGEAEALLECGTQLCQKTFMHLVKIQRYTSFIYKRENEMVNKASIQYISLTITVIMLLIIMSIILISYMSTKQKKQAIEIESERAKFIEQVKDKERNKIYRDLHDTVSQNLGAVALLFNQLTPYINNTEEAHSIAEKISSLNRTNINEIRSIIHNADPINIDTADFKLLLKDLCTAFSSYRNIPCKFFVKDYNSPSLPSALNSLSAKKKLHCYRIMQEAMNNAARHANPSEVSVMIRCTDKSAIFFITDDGSGFNCDEVITDTSHLGLRGMHSRAEEIGANLSISSDEDGTEIRLEVPYA